MIPNKITKEQIEKAIQEIDKEVIRKSRHSSTYNLAYKDKLFPQLLIIAVAIKFAYGVAFSLSCNPEVFWRYEKTKWWC